MRGSLRGGLDLFFNDAEKTLHISLLESTPFWHRLLLCAFYDKPIRKELSEQLTDFKQQLRDYSDRELIYFISKRPRVRLYAPVKYGRLVRKSSFPLRSGGTRKESKLNTAAFMKTVQGIVVGSKSFQTIHSLHFNMEMMPLPSRFMIFCRHQVLS